MNSPADSTVVRTALWVRLEARAGQEEALARFLEGGLDLVREEPATVSWYALRLAPGTFAIFDTFPDAAGREAHLAGRVAEALMARAPELLARPPAIEPAEIIAAMLGG
jgi:quinol monooxygenase YgiN